MAKQGEFLVALKDLNYALEGRATPDFELLATRAFCYLESGQLESALCDVDECLRFDPHYDFCLLIKGWVVLLSCKRNGMKDMLSALPYLRAVAPGPYYARALYGMSVAFKHNGSIEDALHWAERAYTEDPKSKYKNHVAALELLLRRHV